MATQATAPTPVATINPTRPPGTRKGRGVSGRNPDYVRSTHEHLTGMGVTDPLLQQIVQ